jgi:FkbM family methyltransferase
MNFLKSLSKPEYIFRPSQIYRRIAFERSVDKITPQMINLPWGLVIEINPSETIGSCIARQGLYELAVSEALWRLCKQGEIAVDVGANIGHMTGLMSVKLGSSGTVICFEPHPDIFSRLESNIARWRLDSRVSDIVEINKALSHTEGTAILHAPADFTNNQGTASLEKLTDENDRTYEVKVTFLDTVFANNKIGVLKIDVEGHELSVLQGASELFRNKSIRDIIFEEHRTPPTPVTKFLQDTGFQVFLSKRICVASSWFQFKKSMSYLKASRQHISQH